ncbi:uncharacterized protein [Chaetodon trifascialis]|uniref:uncharacterized protein n=1 Tax=Chaetodon trifascialis TaxID=109706 RepID=UPI003992277B
MTSLKFALYLSCLCLWRKALTTNHKLSFVHQESGFKSANVGDSVTLRCFFEGDITTMFFWYKQTLGQKPRLISTFYRHEKNGTLTNEFMNPRFTLETTHGKNHLTISNLQISDSAMYYCISCNAYKFEFAGRTTVSVKGSGVNIPALVHQSASETIQPGDSVTLNCTVDTGTCDEEHSVYWFKKSEESHPGLIYTHGGRSDQCERKPNTQTHTCVYNLPVKSLNLAHAGTYYCAVVSCGHIVFGNGTMLDAKDEVNFPRSLVFILSGALALTTVVVVLLASSVCRMKRRNSCQCADSQRVSASAITNIEGNQDADNLHYAALRDLRTNRSKRQRDNSKNECVYSTVRQ